MPTSSTGNDVKPGDLLRSQDKPLKLTKEFLREATEQALASNTSLVDAVEGLSPVRYPLAQEELFEGIEKLIRGEELPLLSASSITKLAKIIERNLEIGAPEGESPSELAPDLRLILKFLLDPQVEETGFVFSDLHMRFNESSNREIYDLLVGSKPLLEAHKRVCELIHAYKEKSFTISRGRHREILGKLKALDSHLNKLAEDLEFKGTLFLIFRNKRVKSLDSKFLKLPLSELNSFTVEFMGAPLPGPENAPIDYYANTTISELILALAGLKERLGDLIEPYENEIRESLECKRSVALPEKNKLMKLEYFLNEIQDYRFLMEDRLGEETSEAIFEGTQAF